MHTRKLINYIFIAALRLIGALLAEQYEEWRNGARYFDMNEYKDWRKEQQSLKPEKEKIVAIR